MKAAVLYGRGDVRIEDVDVPRPGPGEILLRTRAALTCGTDVKVFRRGYHARMIRPPALFGHEAAGVVEEVGPGVESVAPGQRVVVANSAPCGDCPYCAADRPNLCDDLLFWNGAYAQFARIPARIVEKNTLPFDGGLGFHEAALVEPLACVVRGIEDCDIRPGQCVAILGAGPIGLMLVRLATLRGARVFAVGRNAGRLLAARSLGAVASLALEQDADAAEVLSALDGGLGPEVVIEAVGLPQTSDAALRSVRKGGLVNLFAGCPADARVSLDAQRLHYQEVTVKSTFHHTPRAIRQALRLIEERQVDASKLVTGEATLRELPAVLSRLAAGADGLKTAIRTWDER
jgi:L-iditol 2-dehydrogenase